MIDRAEQPDHFRIVGAAFDPDRRLARGGKHGFDRHRRSGVDPQPVEPRRRQHRRIGLAPRDLVEPGLHIAADRFDPEVGPQA